MGGLLVEVADGGVLLGELLKGGGGGLPNLLVGFLLAAEGFDFAEVGFGGGFFAAELGKDGVGFGDFFFGALVIGGGLFKARGGFFGAIKDGFGFGELGAGELGF